MENTSTQPAAENVKPIPFKAETRQLLDILIHSLYTDREIFLRELISNASDALTRMDFELLTNHNVLDPDAELSIRIVPDPNENTLTITDNGIGMSAEELAEDLGTIAHSGARAFINAVRENAQAKGASRSPDDIIGQFGVGFYSAFMVAESIRVVSRSYRPDVPPASWYSSGDDTFTIGPAERANRGTSVIVKLKEDAKEFLQIHRLEEIIRKHSDFVPFPIYVGEEKEQTNRQVAIWRQNPRQVEQKEYEEFYKQLTLDFEDPLTYAHMVVDAPVQMYSVLFVPGSRERGLFALRREDGLKLYSHKILIQNFSKEVLPEYYRFIQGVVDSEDLPLNVSRESVQSNRVMAQLKKLVTSKINEMLKKLAEEKPDQYTKFWEEFGRYLKEGVATEQTEPENLYPMLRFRTTAQPDRWSSLDDYIQRMKTGQSDIYYILGDDQHSVLYSPHLDIVKKHGFEALILTEPVDAFMMVRLTKYKDHALVNVASGELKFPEVEAEKDKESEAALPVEEFIGLVSRFKAQLGDRVVDVRLTDRLSDSPARLVDPQGVPNQELQRVYRLIQENYQVPKKVLELNPRHPMMAGLNALPAEDPINQPMIEQIFENALLVEGLHPDPVGMIPRIQKLMEAALRK
ncbi:MAG: molecular chaperone HtpG [Omnitrophica WOR_2 bacterium]